MFGRTVNGLTNIWSYTLQDRSLTQITFGTGPDFSPMPDPGGRGIYFVNGKSAGFLTAYRVHSKESTDIVSEDANQPAISPDGKRVLYVTFPSSSKVRTLGIGHRRWQQSEDLRWGKDINTEFWAPDNFHLSFFELETGRVQNLYRRR